MYKYIGEKVLNVKILVDNDAGCEWSSFYPGDEIPENILKAVKDHGGKVEEIKEDPVKKESKDKPKLESKDEKPKKKESKKVKKKSVKKKKK